MSSEPSLTEADEGKDVVNASGDPLGRVVEVRDGDAYVDPDPDLTDSITSKLGWGDSQTEETYRLDSSHVDTVTDHEIRVDM